MDWALPFSFLLSGRKKDSCHPFSYNYLFMGFLFLFPRIHLRSQLELANYWSNKILPSSLSTLATFFLVFPFSVLKVQCSSVPLKMYLFPHWVPYSIEEKKISSFNFWITLIFTLHLSFPLCSFHLHTSKLCLAKHEAAKLESWLCGCCHDHFFVTTFRKWSPIDLRHTAGYFIFADSKQLY